MFQYIYGRPLWFIAFVIIISVCVWALINKQLLDDKGKRQISIIMNKGVFAIVCITIFYVTIFNRQTEKSEICLIPLYSFVLAQQEPEMYRSMFMNVFLFVPFGMTLPYVIEGEIRKKQCKTILAALLYTILIEMFQGIFGIGRAEVDDVICNVLGTVVGSISCRMSCRWG